jgi:hypothetical protein
MSAEANANGTALDCVQPSAELVNGLLKWPEELRLDLAQLLLDSARKELSTLEQIERLDREIIRTRIERARTGQDRTYDAFEVITEMRQRLAERRRT